MTTTQRIGNIGEQLAAHHLTQHGYTILATNWHCQYGEIDIIARAEDATIVFVEVRTRRTTTTQSAFASITPTKQAKLVKSVQNYLNTHDLDDAAWRVDVIGVALPYKQRAVIDHVQDALNW